MSTRQLRSEPVVSVTGLSKSFGSFAAVSDIAFELTPNRIYGLLGRNGAGKTTVMQMLTGQLPHSTGEIRVFGAAPYEDATTLSQVCFIRESQRYPDDFKVRHALAAASRLLPYWDADFAEQLRADFDLPTNRKIKKLSRGMTSAVGVVIGLASRAPLTLFDEPYLGLDAVARTLFYDRLLADFAEHPRTVVLSTHLIDEVSDLIEHVLLIDKGKLILDEDADDLRSRALTVSGPARTVDAFVADHALLHRESLGSSARAVIAGDFSDADRTRALAAGLQLEPVSLQQLVVRSTTAPKETA